MPGHKIKMVDISAKKPTKRVAVAVAKVLAAPEVIAAVERSDLPKGDCLIPAQTAAILAAKNVSSLIPLCHQINLSAVDVDFRFTRKAIVITSTVKARYATGVEMEALAACAVAALVIYDMVKGLDREVIIAEVRLVKKIGGKTRVGRIRSSQRSPG